MPESYAVRLAKDYFIFSAAHFITFNGNVCERLHGHNYRVFAEWEGPLDDNHYVVDFIALRDVLKSLIDPLDHHVLLPTDHPLIQVRVETQEVTATFETRRWVFPREDCVLLPVANTTAELIACYLAHQLLDAVKRRGWNTPTQLRIGVDENQGQWAIYTWREESSSLV